MKLSVIIVSYNVRYFLEKCLVSVFKAMEGLAGEVIVVDNDSADGSDTMVHSLFPQVQLIANHENLGFAKACNQGLRICAGEYVLLLNPDTVVSEGTFTACINFMDSHPDAAACGVRMVDGTGSTLPESMRGLPSPWSAFFKMSGISALFPDSRFFNGYYLGGADRTTVQPVPVLTGAFLFVRMRVIREIGMLDEDYFMYGEDIDWCHRMLRAGYQNYYLPEPPIIHYKGESTHRERLKYVRHFYNAMLIYVRKHYRGTGGRLFKMMIMLGVFVRAVLSAVRRFVARGFPLFIDAVIIVLTLLLVKDYWAQLYFTDPSHFDKQFLQFNLPLYGALWLLFLFLCGAHDLQRNGRRIFNGILIGTLAILVVYAMLPLDFRSSRAVILISAACITLLLISGNALWDFIKGIGRPRRVAIVGGEKEVKRIMEILNRAGGKSVIAGWVAVDDAVAGPDLIGHISQLQDLVRDHRIDELVFSQDLSFHETNQWMSRIGPSVSYRISSSGSDQIVGSDSKKEQGKLYQARVEFALAYPMQRRLKRIADVSIALVLMLTWPVTRIFGIRNPAAWRNVVHVFQGNMTWVSYFPTDAQLSELPSLCSGILYPAPNVEIPRQAGEVHMINYIYAREYTVWKDLDLILRNLSRLI